MGVTGLDSRRNHGREPVELPRQDSPTALAGDLGHWTAEIKVDVIDSVLLAQDRCRLAHHSRVDAIELNGPDIFTLGKGKHAVGLVVPVNQATRRDHFADIQARTLFGTKLAECGIGNAGHGGQHHRGIHRNGASRGRDQGEGIGKHQPMVSVALRFSRNRRASASGTTRHHNPHCHTIPATGGCGPSTTLML